MKNLLLALSLIALTHCGTTREQQFADNETAAFNADMSEEIAYEYMVNENKINKIQNPDERFAAYQQELADWHARRLAIADRHSANIDRYIGIRQTYNTAQFQNLGIIGNAVINKNTRPLTDTVIIQQNHLPQY